jgi:hypothetical protein
LACHGRGQPPVWPSSQRIGRRSGVPHSCHTSTRPRHTHGHSRVAGTVDDLRTRGLQQAVKCSPKQPFMKQTDERPSNQVSNYRHRRQWTSADVDGRCFPGQARRATGSRHRDLASGRRGRRFKSGHPDPGQRPLPGSGSGLFAWRTATKYSYGCVSRRLRRAAPPYGRRPAMTSPA